MPRLWPRGVLSVFGELAKGHNTKPTQVQRQGVGVEDLRIAAAQITCPVGRLAENVEKHKRYTRRAAQAGARVICFSEASLTGYPVSDGVPHELAQSLPGELSREMVALSAETG